MEAGLQLAGEGEGKGEGAAFSGAEAFSVDHAAVCFDQILGDGQTDTAASTYAGARLIHSIETSEDQGQK